MEYKDKILYGDSVDQLRSIPDGTAQMCVTSPPYWGLRDYGHDGQLGLEETPEEYVENMVDVFREVRRVLKDDGTLWLNLGDSYASNSKGSGGKTEKQLSNTGSFYNDIKLNHGLKVKDLVGIPWRVAFALQADGWYLRSDIIWHKPNPMPESVKDRPTKSHEYIFLLSKSPQYYYDWEAIAEEKSNDSGWAKQRKNGVNTWKYNDTTDRKNQTGQTIGSSTFGGDRKNKRSVWQVNTKPYPEAHFAVYPPELIAPCIKAGSKPYDIVLDPFFGSGTTGEVSQKLNRHYLGIELNEDYAELQHKRLSQPSLLFK